MALAEESAGSLPTEYAGISADPTKSEKKQNINKAK
jgi:hypothetical protein